MKSMDMEAQTAFQHLIDLFKAVNYSLRALCNR